MSTRKVCDQCGAIINNDKYWKLTASVGYYSSNGSPDDFRRTEREAERKIDLCNKCYAKELEKYFPIAELPDRQNNAYSTTSAPLRFRIGDQEEGTSSGM